MCLLQENSPCSRRLQVGQKGSWLCRIRPAWQHRETSFVCVCVSEVTGVSPSKGSVLGGTLLTVYGRFFDETDLPARVLVGGKPKIQRSAAPWRPWRWCYHTKDKVFSTKQKLVCRCIVRSSGHAVVIILSTQQCVCIPGNKAAV